MGKSTTARFLSTQGVPVVDTDEIARALVEPGQPALVDIERRFGKRVMDEKGRLRRDELAGIVFADDAARQDLEAILHPPIRARWLAQAEAWKKEGRPVAVVVIPLLFETVAESHFQKILCTACSPGLQTKRLQERGWDADQVRRRIAAQWPVTQKMARADFVIWTDGALEVHGQQVGEIMAALHQGKS